MDKSSTARALCETFFTHYPNEAASFVEGLSRLEIISLLEAAPTGLAATLFSRLNPDVGTRVLETMPPVLYQKISPYVDPSHLALMLSRMKPRKRTEKFLLLAEPLAREVKELMFYPSDRAGYIMDSRYTVFRPETTVGDALEKIRGLKNRKINDVFVTDDDGILQGKISLQTIAVSDPRQSLNELIPGKPIRVLAMAAKDEVVEILEKYKMSSLPVVDPNDKLLGIIRYDTLVATVQQDALADIQTMVGVSPEEKALSKSSFSIRKRLPWLAINLGTTFIAAGVVSIFKDTISQVAVLAVLMPIVAGQSGNTGAQAQAVAIRGLALREIRGGQWWQLLRKEGVVGLMNGIAIAVMVALSIYFWSGSQGLALVIGLAMVIAMFLACLSGAAIPLLLNAFGQDPAQASSIILTTITDVVGYFSFLGLAHLFISLLLPT